MSGQSRIRMSLVLALSMLSSLAWADGSAKVFFVTPKDGSTVHKTFKMEFGETGLQVTPAGKDVDSKTEGHFHVLVDQDFAPEGQVIPKDATHLHYGKGETGGTIKLTPGVHKLTLQFADGAHRSLGQALSQTITVTVK